MHDKATKIVLDTTKEVSLEEPQFMWKSAALRRTICMNEDRLYGQPSPRILIINFSIQSCSLIY